MKNVVNNVAAVFNSITNKTTQNAKDDKDSKYFNLEDDVKNALIKPASLLVSEHVNNNNTNTFTSTNNTNAKTACANALV